MTDSGRPDPKKAVANHKLAEETRLIWEARRGSPARGENGCAYCGAELLA